MEWLKHTIINLIPQKFPQISKINIKKQIYNNTNKKSKEMTITIFNFIK